MGGLAQPMPVIGEPAGRGLVDLVTLGLAELLPSKVKDPLFHTTGQVFFSPLSGLAAGGAGLLGAGGLGGGGFGAAAAPGATGGAGATGLEGLAQYAIPSAGAPTPAATGMGELLPHGGVAGLADIGKTEGLASGTALNAGGGGEAAKGAGMFGSTPMDKLQTGLLATSVGGTLGAALNPPAKFQPPSAPSAPIGHGGGFQPTSQMSLQQLAQLMAQRRSQVGGKFTVG